ncbi:hypothetical protein GF318_04800 [Candidatus Micrarchaeota archaeon]|nr:hypothetical protein [Candidatus Micrarchaeota archaeon]
MNKTLGSFQSGGGGPGLNGSTKADFEGAMKHGREAGLNLLRCSERVSIPIGVVFPAGPGAFFAFISDFVRVYNCMSFRWNWVMSVDSMLRATESSITEAEIAVEDARTKYQELEFLGICNTSYAGTGHEHCSEMKSAFISVDNNITEGKYGKYALLGQHSAELGRKLHMPEPNLSSSVHIISLVWGKQGVIREFSELSEKARQSKAGAESEYGSLEASARGRKAIADEALSEMEKEELSLITSAASSEEYREAGSVDFQWAGVQNTNRKLALLLQEARLESKRITKEGYLRNAIENMSRVDQGYEQLISDILFLHDYSEETVFQQKTEAGDQLAKTENWLSSRTPSPQAVGLYGEAEESYQAGNAAGTLGSRFVYFSRAASLARSARTARDYEQEYQTSASLSKLGNLIERAEREGINVATEKESLEILSELSPYQIGDKVKKSMDSIVSKAKVMFGNAVINKREQLLEKISVAGPGAADLYDEMLRYENGVIADDKILFPDAVGHLNVLLNNYLSVEEELDLYSADMLSNSLSPHATPLISNVCLDENAEILFDVVITNEKPYSAEEALVEIPTGIPFMYSDIKSGKEYVDSVHMKDGNLVLGLPGVQPFETRRVGFEKQEIVMHTLERESRAVGLGGGRARVYNNVDFELDIDVPSLEASCVPGNASVDGGNTMRSLSAGTHTLAYDNTVENAYAESIDNVGVFEVGLNSHVQYSHTITPEINLEKVPVYIDTLNDTRVNSLEIVAVTGETLRNKRRISPTQYFAELWDLEKGKDAIIRVNYRVENTESYVMEQLAYMESINTSSESAGFLDMAKMHAASGNYSTALEFIEQAKYAAKQDEKDLSKLMEKYSEMRKEFNGELDEISKALQKTNASHPFIEKLFSRQLEIQRLFSECNSSNLSEKADLLDDADGRWLEKELRSLQKDIFKEYNDLKEQYYSLGNTGTPGEMLDFEASLNRLQAGQRAEYAVAAIESLEKLKSRVSSQAGESQKARESAILDFESLKNDLLNVLDRYSKQASAAKGTEYSGIFRIGESRVKSALKEAEKAVGEDPRLFEIKLNNLQDMKEEMGGTLASLENESRAKLELATVLIGSQDSLDAEERQHFAEKAQLISRMIESGEYVNALRSSSALAKEAESAGHKDNRGILVLAASGLAIMATVAVYILKKKTDKKQKKPLRKLKSFEEEKNPFPATGKLPND